METKRISINDVTFESDVKANKTAVIFGDNSVDICFEDMRNISWGFLGINLSSTPERGRYTATGDAVLIFDHDTGVIHVNVKTDDGIVSFVIDFDDRDKARKRFEREYEQLNSCGFHDDSRYGDDSDYASIRLFQGFDGERFLSVQGRTEVDEEDMDVYGEFIHFRFDLDKKQVIALADSLMRAAEHM